MVTRSRLRKVGAGVGGMVEGMYPVATLPIYFGVAEVPKGVMKRVVKEVEPKKKVKRRGKKKKAKKK